MNKKSKALISSLADYAFVIIECKKEIEDYAQLVDDQAYENMILKQRVAELEESCTELEATSESMHEVYKDLKKKLEAENELR